MARFNYRTIQNLVADICQDTVPLYAHSERERDALFEKVKRLIESDKRLTTNFGSYKDSNEPDWVKNLNIIFKGYDKYFSPIPYIRFDKSGRLALNNGYSKSPCPLDFVTLQRIIDEVFILIDLDDADKLKKQKIRDLKTHGILAHLNAIAEEDGFEFYHYQIPTRIKLTVKLPEKKLLRIDIPFANFQEVMQQVRPFIKNSRELAATGISFMIEKDKR